MVKFVDENIAAARAYDLTKQIISNYIVIFRLDEDGCTVQVFNRFMEDVGNRMNKYLTSGSFNKNLSKSLSLLVEERRDEKFSEAA